MSPSPGSPEHRDGSHANITIRLYGKIDQFAKFKHANISNSTVFLDI